MYSQKAGVKDGIKAFWYTNYIVYKTFQFMRFVKDDIAEYVEISEDIGSMKYKKETWKRIDSVE